MKLAKCVFYRSFSDCDLTTDGRLVFSTLIYHSIFESGRTKGYYGYDSKLRIMDALEDAINDEFVLYEKDEKFIKKLTASLHITSRTMRKCLTDIEEKYLDFDEDGNQVLSIPQDADLQNYIQLHTESQLKGNDLILYSWLRYLVDDRGNRTRTINKSISDLMDDLSMTEGTIKDSLTRLRKAGLIERIYIGKSDEVVKSRIKVYTEPIDEDKRQMPKKIKRKPKAVAVSVSTEPINVPTSAVKPATKPKTSQRKEDINQLSLF